MMVCSIEDAEERMKAVEGAEADKKSEQEDSGVESPNANRTLPTDKKFPVVETVKSDAATSTAEEKKDSTSAPPAVPPPAKGE